MPPTIGERIKAIREEKCLTQEEATAKADLSAHYLADLESNRIKTPTTQALKQIAAALNIPWEELVVSTVPEASLLKEDKKTMKAWCGNRNCKRNGSVHTDMDSGPFVHTWEANCRDGERREFGIRSYTFGPAYHENGEENRYCGYCGEELISKCWDCGRRLRSGDHTHCTGCGHYLWRTYAEDQPISGDVAPPNDDFASGSSDDFPF